MNARSLSNRLNSVNARRRAAVILSGAVLGTIPSMAHADTLTWVGSGSANSWSIPQNWLNSSGTAIAPQNGDVLIFDANPPFLSNINDISGLGINGMTFTAAASSFSLGGTNALTLNGDLSDASPNAQIITTPLILGGSRTFFVDANGSLTVNGLVSDTGGANLTKTGAGSLALGANNTFTGNTILDGGALVYTADQTGVKQLTIGANAGSTNVGTLNMSAANVTATALLVQTDNSSVANSIIIGNNKTLSITGNATFGVS